MADSFGRALQGDRSAWDTESYATKHARDIYDLLLTRYHWTEAQLETFADTLYIRQDGTLALTGNWDAGSFKITAEQFESDVVTGTAPLVVASTTLVSNLNADLLDSQEGSWYLDLGNATQHLALVKLDSYAQGSIIRGGAADWEAYDAKTLGAVLIGDGTDIISDTSPTIAGIVTAPNFISNVAIGTAPYAATSTTLNTNLNADLLDSQEGAYYLSRANHTGIEHFGELGLLTISGGSITVDENSQTVAAESGTADDLVTVAGGTTYQLLFLFADAGDTITIKHGTGNIYLNGEDDFELSGNKRIALFYDGTNWSDVGAGGGGGGTVDAADVTYTPAVPADWDAGDPGNASDAFDELAERVKDIEEIPANSFGPTWHADGTLTVLTDVGEQWVMPQAGTILEVIAVVGDNGSASSTIVDVNKNGTTIFTTPANRPEIAHDDADNYDVGVPDVTAFAQYDEFTLDIDQVGTDAKDLRVIVVVSLGLSGSMGAASDPVFHVEGALVATTDVDGVWIAPRAATIEFVYIYCRTTGTASSTIVDVNKNGTTIFTTQASRPELDWDDVDGVAKSGAPDVTALAELDVLSIDIDQIGTDAADLTVIVSLRIAAGNDDNAIHDNVAEEIHAITNKATPVDADELVIEDSEDSWNKKRIAISALPSAGGGSTIEGTKTLQTHTVLHSETLSGAGTFDVSSISQDYDHLIIRLKTRSDVATSIDSLVMYFNNDTTATNYHRQLLWGYDGSASAPEADDARIGTTCGDTSTANDFGVAEIFILDYAGSARKQSTISGSFRRDSGISEVFTGSHNWENTNAINRIAIQLDGADDFVAGSYIEIIGIREEAVGGTAYSDANVSDPPTDAELDAEFGTPATVGEGFIAVLNDNSDDTDVYLCYVTDTSWFYIKGTKAT